jgi:chemotaxis signal transduction protein
MTSTPLAGADSFVLLPLGGLRFALPAGLLVEFAQSVRVHHFPNQSPIVSGVIVRRGKIVPVYDAMRVLFGREYSGRHFHLVVSRTFDGVKEMSAIAVDGECELISAELLPTPHDSPAYVAGVLKFGPSIVEVLDFEKLVSTKPVAARESRPQPVAEARL